MPEPETPETVRYHLQHLELLNRQDKDFRELLSQFDQSDKPIVDFLHKASGAPPQETQDLY